ncbi:MAG: HAD hydrolase-like protein, partial [Pseudomonadota bacterium]
MARLIFDLDGTLVHSLPALARAGNALLAELGRPPVTERTYRGYVGRGMAAQVTDLLAGSGGLPEPGLAPHLERFLEIYNADPITGCTLFPGAADALAVLAASHRIGVSTQKPEAAAWHLLEAMGLAHAIEALTGGDTLDVLKPDP